MRDKQTFTSNVEVRSTIGMLQRCLQDLLRQDEMGSMEPVATRSSVEVPLARRDGLKAVETTAADLSGEEPSTVGTVERWAGPLEDVRCRVGDTGPGVAAGGEDIDRSPLLEEVTEALSATLVMKEEHLKEAADSCSAGEELSQREDGKRAVSASERKMGNTLEVVRSEESARREARTVPAEAQVEVPIQSDERAAWTKRLPAIRLEKPNGESGLIALDELVEEPEMDAETNAETRAPDNVLGDVGQSGLIIKPSSCPPFTDVETEETIASVSDKKSLKKMVPVGTEPKTSFAVELAECEIPNGLNLAGLPFGTHEMLEKGRDGPLLISKITDSDFRAATIRAPITVCGRRTQAVVDTGAEVTVINTKFFHSLAEGERPELEKPTRKLMFAEEGRTMDATGVAMVQLGLGPLRVEWPTYIAPINDDMLLGCDFLDTFHVAVDTHRGLLISGNYLPCEIIRKKNTAILVAVKEAVDLPPLTEQVVPGEVLGPSCETPVALLEPEVEDGSRVLVARSLVTPDGGSTAVRLLNPTEEVIHLRHGFLLGTLEAVDNPSLEEMEVEDAPEPFGISPNENEGTPAEEESSLPEHLRSLYTAACANIDRPDVRERLQTLLKEQAAVFASSKKDGGYCDLVHCKINTQGADPVRSQLRPTPKNFEAEEFAYLRDQVELGVIRPSISPWAAPVVLVRKRDGTVRWCVDYRRLNDVTIREAYPIPRIDMCLGSLGGACVFSTLDLQSGYWQIPMDDEDREKTAFITKYGLFEYNRMPFGLTNAVSTFQRLMEMILRGLQWDSLLIYLDDVIIYSRTPEEHVERLRTVLVRLGKAGLKLKPSKCFLFENQVEFLGHLVSREGIRPCDRNIESIRAWEAPKTPREILQFLGLCGYYRHFVRDFGGLTACLTDLTAKQAVWSWGPQHEAAFCLLQKALTEAPVLAFPLDGIPFILDTDASDVGIGGVLSQVQDGHERVISYGSKKLTPVQQRYSVTRRELLAVIAFIHAFRHYLLGGHFTVRTDHSSLRWLFNWKGVRGQIARWREVLSQYDFELVHRPGKKHQNADALSRRDYDLDESPDTSAEWMAFLAEVDDVTDLVPVDPVAVTGDEGNSVAPASDMRVRPLTRSQTKEQREREAAENSTQPPVVTPQESPGVSSSDPEPSTSRPKGEQLPSLVRTPVLPAAETGLGNVQDFFLMHTVDSIRDAQRRDVDLSKIWKFMEAGEFPSGSTLEQYSPAVRNYIALKNCLRLTDGVIYLRYEREPGEVHFRLLVPRAMRSSLLKLCHDSVCAGHMGITKTHDRMRLRFHWYSMRADIKLHILACPACERHKRSGVKPKYPLVNYAVGYPLDRVGVDLMGPFPQTTTGNRYILVVGDYFTRWMEAYAVPDQQAETVARRFVLDFVSRLGAPLRLVSDQGRQFVSEIMKDVCKLLQIVQTRTTPYRPSANGLVERFNGNLLKMLKAYCSEHGSSWDEYLPLVMAAYRATVHPSTRFTPNYLMFGREVNTPIELAVPSPSQEVQTATGYGQELEEALFRAYNSAREFLGRAGERQKRAYDGRTHTDQYELGDYVYCRNPQLTGKLSPFWIGPFVVLSHRGGPLYLLQGKKRAMMVHQDRMKKYRPEEAPSWAKRARKDVLAHGPKKK